MFGVVVVGQLKMLRLNAALLSEPSLAASPSAAQNPIKAQLREQQQTTAWTNKLFVRLRFTPVEGIEPRVFFSFPFFRRQVRLSPFISMSVAFCLGCERRTFMAVSTLSPSQGE